MVGVVRWLHDVCIMTGRYEDEARQYRSTVSGG